MGVERGTGGTLRILAGDGTGERESVAIPGQFGEVPEDVAGQVSGKQSTLS